MIEIVDENKNFTSRFEGTIQEIPTRIGYNKIMSVRGRVFTESTRGVINLSVNINYMDEIEYDSLKKIFLFSDSLKIVDSDKGKVYTSYFLDGDTLNLTEDENLSDGSYYYSGSLTFNRR